MAVHLVLWRWLDGSGMEHCRLVEREAGVTLAGVVIAYAAAPWRIEYEIRCDASWRTRTVTVRAEQGTSEHALVLDADEHGNWTMNGQRRGDLQGCIDVDLGFSPSTNTLPIRRLSMPVGESRTIDAAWLEFPSLRVQRAAQRYTRTGDRTYRYDHPSTGFTATVAVDEEGLVVSYPPGWERVDPATR